MMKMPKKGLSLSEGFPYMQCEKPNGSNGFIYYQEVLIISHNSSIMISLCNSEGDVENPKMCVRCRTD
jgi:hypothetical protein